MKGMRPGHGRALSCLVLVAFASSWLAGGKARAQEKKEGPKDSGAMVVADFEGERVENVHGLALAPVADEQYGGTSETRLSLVHPGAPGSRGAARISFHMAAGSPYPFASVFLMLGPEGLPSDLSAYRGLRFHARSKEKSFLTGLTQYVDRTTRYLARFEAKPEWSLVEVPFANLKPDPQAEKPPAFAPKGIMAIEFGAGSGEPGQVDLDIDQVEFYK
jgi:hypothetical protein